MRLEIDSGGYDSAAEALTGANQMVAGAYSALTSKLGGYGGMGGDDRSSEEFVANYDSAAAEVVGGIADLGTAFGTLGTVTAASGNNHRDANAGSVYGGPGSSSGSDSAPGGEPEQLSAYTPPSSLGADSSDTPEFWDLIVDHLQGWAWPSADTGRLREAAGAWRTMADQLDRTPSYCQTAASQLGNQRSPEIAMATSAVREVEQAGGDLATECRSLADACDEYAEKVDTTKDVVIGLLKDLAIEIGATAVVSGLASLVTFGGAAVVGAGVATARAISCARRIIATLAAIRAIRAVATMARSIAKVTRVRSTLARFRSARALRSRPTGKLPPKGKRNSYGYNTKGDRLPYTNTRPSYGDKQVDDVWRRAQDQNGDVWVRNKDG
ncbi:MAG: hypothetical protein WKF79_08535, partial [Nocardioides sp.]